MDKKIVLFFCLIFFIALVPAQLPFQQVAGEDVGLALRFPPVESVMIGRDVTSHMHVHNNSNGLLLTNTTVNCFVHLYNSTGNHLVEQEMDFDDNGVDFELHILGGNFTISEMQSFIIWCNSSTAGGFVSGSFEVTPTGRTLSEPSSTLYIPLFSLFIFLFLVTIFGIDKLPSSNATDEDGTLIKISYLKYLRATLLFVAWIFIVAMLYIASNLSFAYLEDTLFAQFLFTLFVISFSLTVPIIIMWGIWMLTRIIDDKKIRRLWQRGMFGNKI